MIVIPMAGLSRRFREAGYDRPKYMLDLNGRSLFAHAVESFRSAFDREPFLFIARDEAGTADFVSAETRRLGIGDAGIVIVDAPTRGQADTVRLGLDAVATPADTPITVFNIDTFRPGYAPPAASWMATADGYLEVMFGADPGFSFISPVDGGLAEGRVAETAEKQVISDLASTGLYWFRRADDFRDAFERAASSTVDGELYIAPLYNDLIARGRDIRFNRVPAQQVIFCGTPDQYLALGGADADTTRG